MGEFQKALPIEWGWVESGVNITDVTDGVIYRVDNQTVWVILESSDGKSMKFEPFERIDQKRFKIGL